MWMYQNEKKRQKNCRASGKRGRMRKWLGHPRNRSDWPDWEEARKMEESEWRLEPEGKTEVPEIVVSDAMEGTLVNLDCESRGYLVEAKLSRRRRDTQRGLSVPAKPLLLCDNHCEKILSFWQLASVVLNEDDEAYTTNLCQLCFNTHLQAKGEEPLTNVKWRQDVEKKAYRGRMWKMMEKNHM